MIAIPLVRGSFGKVAGYNQKSVREGGGQLIFSNVASTDAFQIEREFDAVAALRPKARRCAVHLIVAVHPADAAKATTFRFVKWLLSIREFMGFSQSQTVAWLHFDKAHPHMHVLMNRVPLGGPAIPVWGKRTALNQFCARLARSEGLRVASRREFQREHSSGAGAEPHSADALGGKCAPNNSQPAHVNVKQLSSCQEGGGQSESKKDRVLDTERIRCAGTSSEPKTDQGDGAVSPPFGNPKEKEFR